MKKRKAVLVGATGLIGGFCLHALLENEAYSDVVALVRRPLKLSHPKLRTVITTFSDIKSDVVGIESDDVFCCLGTTIKKAGSQEAFRAIDYTLVVDIAKRMKDRGAQQFMVISSLGADENSKVFYNRTKGEMETALASIGYSNVHILRPSLLLGERQEFRFGEKIGVILTPILTLFLQGNFKKYRPIHAKRVAHFMAGLGSTDSPESVSIYESNQMNLNLEK